MEKYSFFSPLAFPVRLSLKWFIPYLYDKDSLLCKCNLFLSIDTKDEHAQLGFSMF